MIKDDIQSIFNRISGGTQSQWTVYNGTKDGYGLCAVKDYSLMEAIIRKAPKEQRTFYALDIGCGNFQWGQGLAEHIDGLKDLPESIEVHIINIRGEQNLEEPVIKTGGRCTLHNLGAFKVEELFNEFKRVGLDLEGKVDLAVSRWTFRHLRDPVGTFVDTYNSLRPGSGFLLMDGFLFEYSDHQSKAGYTLIYNHRMAHLLADTKARFVFLEYTDNRSLDHFMLQRPNSAPCQLPMHYEPSQSGPLAKAFDVAGPGITIFTRDCPEQKFDAKERAEEQEDLIIIGEDIYRGGMHVLYGDKDLYEWVKQNHALSYAGWHPLYKKDEARISPELHQAVLRHDLDAVQSIIDRGCDINESGLGALGYPALHLAIAENQFEIFQFLLQKGADTRLKDSFGNSLFELIPWTKDPEGRFIRTLLDQGFLPERWTSVLRRAIDAKHRIGVKMLLDAGHHLYLESHIHKAFNLLALAS